MSALQTPDGRFSIRFQHQGKPDDEEPRRTRCLVVEHAAPEGDLHAFTRPVAIGYSVCSPDDNYDRETGRQVALFHAVADPEANVPRDDIIAAYQTRTGAKAWRLDRTGHIRATPPPARGVFDVGVFDEDDLRQSER